MRVIVPIPMDEAGVANGAAQLPPAKKRDGITVDFVAVPWGAHWVTIITILCLWT